MRKILSVVQQIISQWVLIRVMCKSYGRNWRKVGQQARNLRSEETLFPVPVRIRMSQVPPITAFDETIDLEIAIVCHVLMFNFKKGEVFTEQASLTTSIAYFYLLLSKSPYTFLQKLHGQIAYFILFTFNCERVLGTSAQLYAHLCTM